MVEASSRKKGKNSPVGSYGNQTHYSQGYPQPMERYHSGYPASYQSPRYQCNNNTMDYQCTSNTMHYPQTATNNIPHNTGSGQTQYNQYHQSSASNYRYYQGNNASASAAYNTNMPNTVNDSLCRFGRSATSTPVPQEQGYYSHQYSTPQQAQNMQDIYNSGRGCSMQENLTLPVANQITNDLEQLASYSTVNTSIDAASLKPDNIQLQKSNSESFGNINMDISLTNTVADPSQDSKMCMKTNYTSTNKIITVDPATIVTKSFTTGTTAPQSYQQPILENNALNKAPEVGFYPETPSFPNRNQSSYINHIQNAYPNQKLPYQGDYHNKEQMQSSQYARYSETQNESYRGSEGPPIVQVERNRNVVPNDVNVSSSTPYQYNCASSKPSAYTYAPPQQGHNKDSFNSSAYCNQYNNRPQRAWLSEQNQHSYQNGGQRPQLKTPVNPSETKQLPEVPRARKSWLSFQNSAQIQSKHQSVSTTSTSQNQAFVPVKTQPQTNTSPAPQALPTIVKKPLEFPPNTVESVRPVAVRRRRCPAKRLGAIDPWRLMLALKSGLLAESTWALDTIAILLADNSTVVYFNLEHLPGLLNVLVDHYRCFLNKIFNLAKDMELGKAAVMDKKVTNDQWYLGSSDVFNLEDKIKILDEPNFTYKTRCKKKIEIQYDEALFLIDPQRSWDVYEDFDVSSEHWLKGGGDITSHIQTCFAENTKNVKFFRELNNEKTKDSNENHVIKNKSKVWKSSLLYKGEPIVVLKKFNFDENKATVAGFSESEVDAEDSCSLNSNSSHFDKQMDLSDKKEDIEKDSMDFNDSSSETSNKDASKSESSVSDAIEAEVQIIESDSDKQQILESKSENCDEIKECVETSKSSNKEVPDKISRLRGSLSSRKRFLCEDLEDEAYCYDQPALCVMSDSQEMISRRCVCVSTILRNLSFVPGNDVIMSKNPGVLVLLGRLLLLHHEHKPAKNAYHKYEKEADGNSWDESCISLKDDNEWWWSTLNVLRDNTLVILSNISGHLDLSPFPEEVSLPILDGLLHWVVCPSSYAQDPLPSRTPSSVLSPQRLCLETLCKLSVLSSNVDLIIATPPWSRIENLLTFLTKSLSLGQDQIMREFAVILLSNISETDSVAARTIAEQGCCISYLIAFIEEAEANAFQIASSQGTKKLRDKPELMGTTPGMVQRAANTLKNLALVPENRVLFMRYQPQLLSLVMSQVMDQELSTIIADVLFYCSDDDAMDICNHLPIS